MKNLISIREIEILQLISLGLTSSEIAEKLFISTHTASTHRKNIIRKLGARNAADLVRIGFEQGIISMLSNQESAPTSFQSPSLWRTG